ncbi:MAG: hypothetical protein KKE62_10045 [Proteobacteria bacterium]|nr:hypothetical protein [Pseudomonadota bacterium]MBU1388827.1 hypothetical protein [Pseudomonadota bacterium]MBU1543168.1 hypothetical protein [Pseudomonadota bacterium]MBU2480013.1 hypothetical protein [Pseudomonadota bacterium]
MTDRLQRKFIWITSFIFLFTIGCALIVKSGGDLYLQPAFFHLFARYDFPGSILLISILFICFWVTPRIKNSWIDKCLAFLTNHPIKISVFIFLLMAFFAFFIYHRYPLCMDEYLPYFQSKIFSEGKLWGQYPPQLIPWLLQPGFFSVFSAETGRVVSDYWPGFAILLTPFMKSGIPWILNPLISAGTIFLLFYYSKKILPDASAGPWVVLLTISSSVFLINGISFYSMSAHLFFNLVFAILLLKFSPARLFCAGMVGSFALVLNNPIPHITFVLPWILWLCFKKNRLRNIGILFAGYLPLTLVLGLGWPWIKLIVAQGVTQVKPDLGIQEKITTAPFAYNHFFSMFFNKLTILIGTVFRLPGSEMLWARLLGWLKIFAWSLPGLPILAILGIRFSKGLTHLQLWGCSAILTLFVYLFIPFDQGHGWGFRYFHSAWLALPLFSAAFLTWPTLKNAAVWKKFICVLSILSIIFSCGFRLYQVQEFVSQHLFQYPVFEKNNNYICIMNTGQGYYTEDIVQNDPFLRKRIIILRSVNKEADLEMMQTLFPKAKKIISSSLYTLWEIE